MILRTFAHSIAVVICYFGKLPWYFDYFMHTAKYNPTIDFIVFSDDRSYSKPLPHNIKIIFKTLEGISSLLAERLDLKIEIKKTYKICDFKPVFGLVFSDVLKKYDFWGYGDIDVIFGNIRKFITPEILINYDIISVRHDYLTGYFQLFRNNEAMTKLFMQSKDYRKVFESDLHYCFDETNFRFDLFRRGVKWFKIDSEIESMMHIVRKLEEKKEIRAYFGFHVIEGRPGRLKWRKGKLTYLGQFEIILYHMIHFKKVYMPGKGPKQISSSFTVSPNKIYNR